MGISNKYSWPEDETDFEAMCHVLYNRVHSPDTLSRVGRKGQKQFGLDIFGVVKGRAYGIQCKYFTTKKFTLETVKGDIEKAENEPTLKVDHIHFVTIAPSDSEVVKSIVKLCQERQKEGKFSISVEYWDEICGHIRVYPEVGQAFIPNFPGNISLRIESSIETLVSSQKTEIQNRSKDSEILHKIKNDTQALRASMDDLLTSARGDEVDPHLTASLDLIRDNLKQGKTNNAKELLERLGDPYAFKDEFSKFRWITNNAFVQLLEGQYEKAAHGFLEAFKFAENDEKAHVNRTHAYILLHENEDATKACDGSLEIFPESFLLWSLKIHIHCHSGKPLNALDIPDKVKDSSDVLYALADERRIHNDYEGAIRLIKESLTNDPDSFNSKRAFLADALLWCGQDPVMALHGQLTSAQATTLREALNHFEPLETQLPSIQSDKISEEVVNNTIFALILLGETERAYSLTDISLYRHPLLEGLLRTKLLSLDNRQDIAAIHKLVDHRLKDLPVPILCILAEISATSGEPEWNKELMDLLVSAALDAGLQELLEIYSIHSLWVAGSSIRALEQIREYSIAHPDSIHAYALHVRILHNIGFSKESIDVALQAFKLIHSGSSPLEILQTANILFLLDQYQQAGSLFERLLTVVGNNEITVKSLVCLIETDQRSKAQDIFAQLPKEVLDSSEFRRIRINFYRRTGNWDSMLKLLELELKLHPLNLSIGLGYVGTLYRLNMFEPLKGYLQSNPVFENSSIDDEFEFSKYQAHSGFPELALARLYKQYRTNPSDTKAASCYLTQILLGKTAKFLEAPTIVEPGSVVVLASEAENRTIAIDFEPSSAAGWPELISPDTKTAKKLFGLQVGDEIQLPGSFAARRSTVIEISSMYSYAAQLANEVISKAVDPAGPIYSVQIIKKDGQPDIEVLLRSASERRKQVDRVFKIYREHRIPISMVAKSLGTDLVTLFLEWPYQEVELFVGQGTHVERESALNLILEKQYRYVLDLTAVAEFAKYDCFDRVTDLIGRPLIPTTAKEQLLLLIQLASGPQATSSFSEIDGKLAMTDTPPHYYEERLALLKQMMNIVDACETVPTIGPKLINETHNALASAIDHSSLDSIYLSGEREAVFVTEDGSLRTLSMGAGVPNSIGIQPILLAANNLNLIASNLYADIIFDKLTRGHSFVSVRGQDLLEVASRTPDCVSEQIRFVLNTFKQSTVDLASAIVVCKEFLRGIFSKAKPRIVAGYYEIVLTALLHNRHSYAKTIKKAIAEVLVNSFRTEGQSLKADEINLLKPYLEVASPLQRLIREKLSPLIVQHREKYFPFFGVR